VVTKIAELTGIWAWNYSVFGHRVPFNGHWRISAHKLRKQRNYDERKSSVSK